MNRQTQIKKQRKKSTGSRFEVSPLKSPPLPRRLNPIHNLDGTLVFPSENSNTPYKLRKRDVSCAQENNNAKNLKKNSPIAENTVGNSLVNFDELANELSSTLVCKECYSSNYLLENKTVAGIVTNHTLTCKKCNYIKPLCKEKKSKFYKKKTNGKTFRT